MHLLTPLLATWACLAQVGLAGVAFTKWPTTAYTGKPATITWNGDGNAPATITLRKGPSGNLKTLKVLTTQAGGGSFTWVPDKSLPDGSDYAFQIEQNGSINYSGLVTLAHERGKEPPLSTSNSPLGSLKTGVKEGNNGHVPALNVTSHGLASSSKSTAANAASGCVSLRTAFPEMILGAMAAIVYFAA
ncbi:Ser-Thr-rich glycosyl-phosphatidyl-inositol-anchored membrane family-domain-containing protein [Aspergillus egyptiacus]|nr:Ser-Thr-rich glycosyl-phosphatidyl-inositol-anchored membrane family-domain-containing protein [Aspergillus egyptiacus]